MHVSADVDVVASLECSIADIAAEAQRKHAGDLQAYREGIHRLAENGGKLPPAEADRLLHASRDLGISPERLSRDTEIMLRATRVEAEIEATLTRNAERREPLARLRDEYEKAQAAWLKVRVECEQRLKAEEAKLNEKTREFQAVESLRDERVDQQQEALVALRNAAPHLFADVSAAELDRIVDRTR
jgi:hypothetical protein